MEEVKSRYRFLPVIIFIICLVAAAACWYYFASIGTGSKDGRRLLFFAVLLTLYIAALTYNYLAKYTGITVSAEGITLRFTVKPDEFFSWSDIETITPVAQQAFSQESSVIRFKGGKLLVVANNDYANANEVRAAIQRNFSENEGRQADMPVRGRFSDPKRYAGNPWTAYNTILFLLTLVVGLLAAVYASIIFYLVIPLGFYFFFGFQMYYFQVSGDLFVVRNHYWFWYQKTYRLDDIKSLVFQLKGRRSSGLGIVLNDFISKSYSAGSLRKKDWRRLRDDSRSLGIDFQNDAFLK